ncbi:MAG: DUF6279 family lipoprotein, partial [Cellvibrionaceae bacterium]|nr:DUF6279 family lipoprotein [Cellvibrionaceae bacterium]
REQREQLSLQIDELHSWHQQQELPRYLALLDEAQQRLEQEQLQAEDMAWLEAQVTELWGNLLAKGGPMAADWLLALEPPQLDHLYDKLGQDNQELREKYIEKTEPERRRQAEKQMSKQWRKLIGRLNEPQRAYIKNWSQQFTPSGESQLLDKLAWQQRLSDILARRDSSNSRQQLLDLFKHEREDWVPERRESWDKNSPIYQQFAADMINSASPKQRGKLHKKLQQYRQLLEDLATEPL